MRGAILILILVTSFFASGASATGGCSAEGEVAWCAGDRRESRGDCDGDFGVESDRTGVTAATGGSAVWAYGYDSCFHAGESSTWFNGVRVGAASGDTSVGVGWASGHYVFMGRPGTQCSVGIGVTAAGTGVSRLEACPVGPPNPGWGHVLP